MSNFKKHLQATTSLGLYKKAVSLAKNKDGVAAIEFAFIAPIMIAMYFGLAEISHTIGVDRNISHSANVAGDLMTQSAVITKADVANYMSATMKVMSIPSEYSDRVGLEINSYRYNDDSPGDWELVGQAKAGNAIAGTYDPATEGLIPRLLSPTSGAVVARVTYNHEPVTTKFLSNITLNETFVLKPRKSTIVEFEEGIGTTYNCTISSTTLDVTCP